MIARKWTDADYIEPMKNYYVVLYRATKPTYFWMGKFENFHDEEHPYEYWIRVDKPPEEK